MDSQHHLRYFIAVLLAFAIAISTIGLGTLGCKRQEMPEDTAYENLMQAREAYYKGDIIAALDHAIDAEYDFERIPISKESARAELLLSIIYYTLGLEEEALDRLENFSPEELKLLEENLWMNYYVLSAYLYATVRNDSSKVHSNVNSILEYHASKECIDSIMLYRDYTNLAEIYIALDDTANSAKFIRHLDEFPMKNDLTQNHYMNICKALYYDKCGMNDSAETYAKKILSTSYRDSIDIYNIVTAYSILLKNDSLRNDLPAYAAHRDSLDYLRYEKQGVHNQYMIAEIKARNRAENVISDMNAQKRQAYLWVLLGACAVLLIISIILWKYRERKARHRIAVLECSRLAAEVKNKELLCERLEGEVKTRADELARHISEKNELTQQLRQAMCDVASISPLDHLHLRLNQDHPEFMAMLHERFPELSANDRLILGAIKEGLSPKDTATALSISHSSLLTARYRLRKKLSLDPSTNLDDFVLSLK